ncbi:hypothetical protein [Chitinimonas sp.]|uniref:c-type cytochrome n=1 Tax=Chitinimonas sp. TaxID=1934313 RepID=UPI002F938E71
MSRFWHSIAVGLVGMLSVGTVAAVPDTLAQRLQACTACHGAQGKATSDGYYPRIAGKPADYLYNQLIHFRDGRRNHPAMVYMVRNQPEAYLREIAQYFSDQHLPYPAPQAGDLDARASARGEQLVRKGDAAQGLPACMQCHGPRLTGMLPAAPGLLGLPRDYLYAQLSNWRNGRRQAATPDCMARVAKALSQDDLVTVASWLSTQPVPVESQPAVAASKPLPLACGSLPQ